MSFGDAAFTPLKTFLQKHALNYERLNLARTYAAFAGVRQKVVGYVTLVCGEVATDEGDSCLVDGLDYRYPRYPAVKIARLAVDQSVQGRGLGRHLVELALGVTKREVCPLVGCRFVMVDSKKNAVKFYERCGFTILETRTNRSRPEPVMFVDLSKID